MTAGTSSPLEGYLAKLERRAQLPPEARAAVLQLPVTFVRAEARDVLAQENAESRRCLFVASGFVSRQKLVSGTRNIMGIGITDDAMDLQSLWFRKQDHTLVAHQTTTLIAVDHAEIIRICKQFPDLMGALWHDTLVDAAIFREWALNIAHRRAPKRIAHLLLELAYRYRANGLIDGDVFTFPFTQTEMASALGLSLVHLNKSLRLLREQEYVAIDGRTVSLLDRAPLEKTVGFDPNYLHVTAQPRRVEELEPEPS